MVLEKRANIVAVQDVAKDGVRGVPGDRMQRLRGLLLDALSQRLL